MFRETNMVADALTSMRNNYVHPCVWFSNSPILYSLQFVLTFVILESLEDPRRKYFACFIKKNQLSE